MSCKGVCIRYKAMKEAKAGRYIVGQKRCQVCDIFMRWDGIWCPCCGYRLRSLPRNSKYKQKVKPEYDPPSPKIWKSLEVDPQGNLIVKPISR